MWAKFTESEPEVYNFCFYSLNSIDKLMLIVSKTQYESNSRQKFEDLNEEDQKWIIDAIDDKEESYEDANDIIMDYANEYQEDVSEVKNKATTQAYLHDRTFVVKEDNTIGVYKTDDQETLTVRIIV